MVPYSSLTNWKRRSVELLAGVGVIVLVWALIILLGFILYRYDPLRYGGATHLRVAQALADVLSDKKTFTALYYTLFLAAKGLFVGMLAAAVVGIGVGLVPELSSAVVPIPNALRAIPLTLLIPFLVAVPSFMPLPPGMQADLPARDPAYLIGLGAFLYLVIGIVEGISHRSIEREKIFRRIRAYSRIRYFFEVLVFESVPAVLGALRLAVLFALVLAIVFEQLLQLPGVGRMISLRLANSSYNNELEAEALALLFVVAILGIAIDFTFVHLREKWNWTGSESY